MYFFHHAIFLELVKGSQLYFSVSPYRTLYAYQADSLSNCSALHTNWIFSNMNHLTTLVRAMRTLLKLHVSSCLMAEILAQSRPAPLCTEPGSRAHRFHTSAVTKSPQAAAEPGTASSNRNILQALSEQQ